MDVYVIGGGIMMDGFLDFTRRGIQEKYQLGENTDECGE